MPIVVDIILTMTTEDAEERTTSGPLFGKGALLALLTWGLIVLVFSVGGIADVTRFWWLVLLFGTAAPVVLVAVRGRSLSEGTVKAHVASVYRKLEVHSRAEAVSRTRDLGLFS